MVVVMGVDTDNVREKKRGSSMALKEFINSGKVGERK